MITVADGTVYPVQSEGEIVLRSICGAILALKGVLYVPSAKIFSSLINTETSRKVM
jgi:hypothetical protein